MTFITKPNATELKKWRDQATKAAAALKAGAAKPQSGANFVRAGFAFDDEETTLRVIKLDITLADIDQLSVADLAQTIYDGVLMQAQEHTPPAGHA
jgi:hypothetical protein